MDTEKGIAPIDFEDIITNACKLPYCKIDRDAFLTKQLKGKINSEQLASALEYGTINAEVPIERKC